MASTRLIIALDTDTPDSAEKVAEATAGDAYAFKIGWPLLLDAGISVIKSISSLGNVICDLKIADIPNTNSAIARRIRDAGAWGIIAHSFAGTDSLSAIVSSSSPMKVFSVAAMSHPGSSEFINKVAVRLAKASEDAGSYGLVAPGNNPEMLIAIRQAAPDMTIISPGIGVQGGDAMRAILCGADYVIVGRSICNSQDPHKEAQRINSSIEGVFKEQNKKA